MTKSEKNLINAALDVAKNDLKIVTISVDDIKAEIEPEMSLITAIKRYEAAKTASKNPLEKQPFSMSIEDIFHITGRGIVITGKIASGTVCLGDLLEIVSKTNVLHTKCVGIEKHRKLCDQAKAGEPVGILISGISRSEIKSGSTLRKQTNC